MKFAIAVASVAFAMSALADEPAYSAPTCWEIVRNQSTADNNDKCVAMAGPLAAVRNGKLVLRMDSGQRKTFGDHSGGDSYGYALMDFYPATHVFVVGDMGDDGGSFQAIDGRTGHVAEFGPSQPHYAPHGGWILLAFYDEDEAGAERTTFSVLDARGDKPKSVWTSKADPTTLPGAADFIAWRDDAHAELALPGGFHLILTHDGSGPWHYDLAALSLQKVAPEARP